MIPFYRTKLRQSPPVFKIILQSLHLIFFLTSCSSVKDIPKYNFSDGFYTAGLVKLHNKVFIKNEDDSLNIFPVSDIGDTTVKPVYLPTFSKTITDNFYFHKRSFDIDFLTIPFKYRPPVHDFPNQFNTSINGAVYIGFRDDLYRVKYKKDFPQSFKRYIDHFGFSAGGFAGIGGTVVNKDVTNGKIPYDQYDGVVFSKGLAGIIGINNFTIGVALGFDNLLDANKDFWIYDNKWWLGLGFGLNLN